VQRPYKDIDASTKTAELDDHPCSVGLFDETYVVGCSPSVEQKPFYQDSCRRHPLVKVLENILTKECTTELKSITTKNASN
jgi:hypothetical protein